MSGLLDGLAGLASPWGYLLIGLLAAAEAAAFVGLLIPGEAAMLAGGFLVFRGRADLWIMMSAAGAGAVAGDSIGYEVGRHFGGRLRRSRMGRRIGQHRWEAAEAYLERRGGRAVFFGRFVGVLRALVPAIAGASGLAYRRFLFWNALGGLIWAPGLVLAGYLAGNSYRRVERVAGRAGLVILVVVLLLAAVTYGVRRARRAGLLHVWVDRAIDQPAVRRLRNRFPAATGFAAARLRAGHPRGLSLTLTSAVLVVAGVLFGGLLEDVAAQEELVRYDRPATRYLAEHRSTTLTQATKLITYLGSTTVLIPIVLLVGIAAWRVTKSLRPLVALATAQAGAIVFYDVLKVLVARPRPHIGPLVATASGASFPSGHATQAVAVWGALAYLAARATPHRALKATAWGVSGLIVLLVGFSRIYLGLHWATDVAAGWALGAAWLAAVLATVAITAPPPPPERPPLALG